ncbi:MAG: hypothetical protein ACRCVS_03275 [Fusobacteriaceae bacterium]
MIKRIIDKTLIFFNKKLNLTTSSLKVIYFLILLIITVYFLVLIPIFKYFNLKNDFSTSNYKNEELKNKKTILKKKLEVSEKLSLENKIKFDSLLNNLHQRAFSNQTSVKQFITDGLLRNNLSLNSISRLQVKIPQTLTYENLNAYQIQVPFDITGTISDFDIFFKEIEASDKYVSILENDIVFELTNSNLKIKFKVSAFILYEKNNLNLDVFSPNNSQFKIGKLESTDSLNSIILNLDLYSINKTPYLILTFINGEKKTFSKTSEYRFKNKIFYIEFLKNKIIIKDKESDNFLIKLIPETL